jgi:S1-C subfamily serine protease
VNLSDYREAENMKRSTLWIVAVVSAITAFAAGMFIVINTTHTRNLGGPVAIVKGEPPKHGFLGIEFESQPPTPLTVKHVIPGTGAAQAGIQSGDVVIAIEDQSVPTIENAIHLVQVSKPNSHVRMTIRRDDNEQELHVRLIGFSQLILLRERDTTNRHAPSAPPSIE